MEQQVGMIANNPHYSLDHVEMPTKKKESESSGRVDLDKNQFTRTS
jgi:hypothetical protein